MLRRWKYTYQRMRAVEELVTDKVIFANVAAGALSMSQIDMAVKILVGLAVLVYTIARTVKVIQEIKGKNNEE